MKPEQLRNCRSDMEDLKHLEFLAVNSKEIIEKQVDSYRQQHSYTVNIIETEKGNKRYANGIRLATIALIISILLMMTNK